MPLNKEHKKEINEIIDLVIDAVKEENASNQLEKKGWTISS
jgi:hypothetical protein